MPTYHSNQAGGYQSACMNNGNPTNGLLFGMISCAIRKKVDNSWEVNYHDEVGWQAIASETQFTPPFQVRFFNLVDAAETLRWIKYDSAGNGDIYKGINKNSLSVLIKELFHTNTLIPISVTRVHFDETTATEIHLHG